MRLGKLFYLLQFLEVILILLWRGRRFDSCPVPHSSDDQSGALYQCACVSCLQINQLFGLRVVSSGSSAGKIRDGT